MTATNKTTSEETDAGPLDGTEEVRLAIAGSNYKTTTQAIANLAPGGATYTQPPVTAYTGTTHQLALTDAPASALYQGITTYENAAGIAVTVPPKATVAWVKGHMIQLFQKGVGQVSVVASGNTIHTPASLTTRAQFSTLLLTYLDDVADVWSLSGDMT